MKTDPSQQGSLLGAILLITGCCIGAGMLGLPVMSALSGFIPSLLMFFLSWLFMFTTALLLLEVNLWFSKEVSLITMSDQTLGTIGKWICAVCFLFLFYALGVAYISASGELIASFFLETFKIAIPYWVGSVLISISFGVFVCLGTAVVDRFNRWLIFGLASSYLLLIAFGASHVNTDYLLHQKWNHAYLLIPFMIISFGFHNLIPSLSTYLQWDKRKLVLAIFLGSALPLMIYLIWEWLILGLVATTNDDSFLEILDQGNLATHLLKKASNNLWVVNIAEYFALFAILTSFLGNTLSFVDFLADGLSIKKEKKNKLWLSGLVIFPTLILALVYPRLFLSALNYAGAFGAVTLFGILPALMVWSGRYHKKLHNRTPLVPGGKPLLILILLFCFGIIAMQFVDIYNPIKL